MIADVHKDPSRTIFISLALYNKRRFKRVYPDQSLRLCARLKPQKARRNTIIVSCDKGHFEASPRINCDGPTIFKLRRLVFNCRYAPCGAGTVAVEFDVTAVCQRRLGGPSLIARACHFNSLPADPQTRCARCAIHARKNDRAFWQ